MSSCSVVIVAKNGGSVLFATIETVLQQKQLAELIIVDNGNSPAVISRLQQLGISDARLKIIAGGSNLNYAKSCNIAARQATSKYLIFLKSGYLLSPDALLELTSVFSDENKTMLSSGLVQRYDGSLQVVPRSKIITPQSVLSEIIGTFPRQKKTSDDIEDMSEKPYDVATIASACMCVRASDYKKLGGMDDELYPQNEEYDFPLRVKQIGGRVVCVPSVQITHLSFGDDKRIPISQQLNETQNILRYFNKFFVDNVKFGVLFLLYFLIWMRQSGRIVAGGAFEFFAGSKSGTNNIVAKRLMLLALGAVEIPKTNKLAKKIVLVTGATSQVGLCVIRRLIASGAAVIAVSRNDGIVYRHPHLRWIKGDLTDSNFSLDGYCVDAVVHCAPLWHLPAILDLLKNAEAKRVIAFSSTVIFSNLLAANHFEKDFVLRLQNAEKLLAEKSTALDIRYSIFRPTPIYGVGLDYGVTTIAKIIRKFGAMFVYPPAFGRRQPVHVDDLAVAVLQAMDNETTYDKSYNLSGGEVLSYREMLAKLFAIYEKKPRIISSTALPFILDMAGKILRKKYINGEIARRMNDDLVFFYDDATRDFGYSPRKFLSGGLKDIERF